MKIILQWNNDESVIPGHIRFNKMWQKKEYLGELHKTSLHLDLAKETKLK